VDALAEQAPASRAAVLEARYRSRLPRSLDDLAGPAHGTVDLPQHVAWSGVTSFDVDRPGRCRSMYHILLTDGQADDLTSFLDRRLLVSQWPVLRRMVGRIVRDVWESAFPELGEGHQAAS
jgi:hypothetical protein